MNVIDLTASNSEEDNIDSVIPHTISSYVGPNLIMGIDIGPRNSGCCIYSIWSDSIVWWTWVDLQGYYPVHKTSHIVNRLGKFVDDYRHIFDACDDICIEGQTEVQTQRINMYLQNAFTAMFRDKISIQNSTKMGNLMRELAPESFVATLSGKSSRQVKKRCTVWVGKRMIRCRDDEKMLYTNMIRDRRKHQKFIKSKKGVRTREVLEELDDNRLREQGKGNKRAKNKRIPWSSKLNKEDYDIWDAFIIALLEAGRQTKKDIIRERLRSGGKRFLLL